MFKSFEVACIIYKLVALRGKIEGEFNDGLLYPSATLVNNPHPCNLFSM